MIATAHALERYRERFGVVDPERAARNLRRDLDRAFFLGRAPDGGEVHINQAANLVAVARTGPVGEMKVAVTVYKLRRLA